MVEQGFRVRDISSVSEVKAAAQQFNGYVRRYLSLNLFYADKGFVR
ncbi:unnamed protein product [Brassica oleracea var. botrytis]